jgi:hypothetical protein
MESRTAHGKRENCCTHEFVLVKGEDINLCLPDGQQSLHR